MASFKNNEEGVSAVIGVILMVAITVILAAVIAAFVFQLGGDMPTNKNVALDVKRVNSTAIYVKNMGGTDAAGLISGGTMGAFNVTANGIDVTPGTVGQCNSTIGSMQYFHVAAANAQLTIVGNFNDGSQQVLWSGTI